MSWTDPHVWTCPHPGCGETVRGAAAHRRGQQRAHARRHGTCPETAAGIDAALAEHRTPRPRRSGESAPRTSPQIPPAPRARPRHR